MDSVDRIRYWNESTTIINDSSSTQSSSNQPRELILQSKGKEYEIHKQKLRHEQEEEQMLLSPFHPEIHSNYTSTDK